MKKPRILLSGKNNLQYYTEAVEGVGAEAVAQYLPEVDTTFDGLILCGGSDIHPKYYKEEMNGSVNIDPDRDTVEFALLQAYVEAGKPVLGICRGHQLINVFFGGTLYQDLPESSVHTNTTDNYLSHGVTAQPDSFLAKLYGTSLRINSSHHQAVKSLGSGLRACACWEGKYIEAIDHVSLPIWGVQWHPERMCFGQKRPDTDDGAEIFKFFVQMCKK